MIHLFHGGLEFSEGFRVFLIESGSSKGALLLQTQAMGDWTGIKCC
jgi:hypothetical protein